MNKRSTYLVLLLIFLLLFTSCGEKEDTPPVETPTKENVVDNQAEETPSEENEQITEQITKELIKAAEDPYSWPEPAKESDFDFDEETGTILGYKGTEQVLVIPQTIQNKPVLRIGNAAFQKQEQLTHIKFPENLRVIQTSAFYFLEKIEHLSLPSTLEIIEPYAFFHCTSLKTVTFPPSLFYLGKYAFFGFEGEKMSFLGELPLMGEQAITLPEDFSGEIRVADEEKEKYDLALNYTCTADGACNYVDRTAKQEDFVVDETGKLVEYKGDAHYLIIPDEINGKKVTSLNDQLFLGNQNIYRLRLPSSLEKIGERCFFGTPLAAVDFPKGLKEIGAKAFSGCKLEELVLPGSLEKITDEAFSQLQIESLTIPEGVKEISKGAFLNSEIKEVYLPSSLSTLGPKSFGQNTKLKYVVMASKTLPIIDPTAFEACPIEDLDIAWNASKEEQEKAKEILVGLGFPDTVVWRGDHPKQPPYPDASKLVFDYATGLVKEFNGSEEHLSMYWDFANPDGNGTTPVRGLADGLFKNSSIKSFYVPHSGDFTSIGKEAFFGSQLEEIHLFDSVTNIDEKAFANCKMLKSITLPESVETIGNNAFEACESLEEVIFQGKNPKIGLDAFKGCTKLTTIILPEEVSLAGSLGIDPGVIRFKDAISDAKLAEESSKLDFPWYRQALRESEKDSYQQMPTTYVPNLPEDFDFNSSTGTIEKYNGPGGTVVIPSEIGGVKVEKIGFLAFSNFTIASVARGTEKETTLEKVILPETMKVIDDSAFLSCSTLKSIVSYGPIEYLGVRAFEDCTKLEEALFVNGLKEMAIYAFNLDESLKKVDFAGKLKVLPEGAFYGCGFSGEVYLDYEEIEQNAMQNCKNISVIRVPQKVKRIGVGAFQGIDKLEKVYFEKPDATILGKADYQFTESNDKLKIVLPKTATDDEVNAFVQMLKENLFTNAENMVIKE